MAQALSALRDGAGEIFALDSARGLIASKSHIYEVASFHVVADTLRRASTQMFFDRDGLLWYLLTSQNALVAQQAYP